MGDSMKNKLKISNTRIKNIFKNNIKIVIGFTIGLLIAGASVYAATIYFASSEVSYDDTKVSGTLGASTVQDALDELYDKAKNCGNYTKVNITNGTVSPSGKNVVGNTTTFAITPTTDYGCNNDIDWCVLNCNSGATISISSNSTTLTVSNITRNTECTVDLTRIQNFSYTTNSSDTYLSSIYLACCSASMPTFSTTYGTFKMTGKIYEVGSLPLNYYCSSSYGSDSVVGSSCTAYSSNVSKMISCKIASTDSHVCGGDGSLIPSYTYNATTYNSNRSHQCRSTNVEGLAGTRCPEW